MRPAPLTLLLRRSLAAGLPLLLAVAAGACTFPAYPLVRPMAAYDLPVSVLVQPGEEPMLDRPGDWAAATGFDAQRLLHEAIATGPFRPLDGEPLPAPEPAPEPAAETGAEPAPEPAAEPAAESAIPDESAPAAPADATLAALCAAGKLHGAPVVFRDQVHVSTSGKRDCKKEEGGHQPSFWEEMLEKHPERLYEPGYCTEWGPYHGVAVAILGTVSLVDTARCEVLGQLVLSEKADAGLAPVQIRQTTAALEQKAIAKLRTWIRDTLFARTALRGRGGDRATIASGSADGVAAGQRYAVLREDRVTHELVVTRVALRSADLAVVEGDPDLRDGDAVYTSHRGRRIVIAPLFTVRRLSVGGRSRTAFGGGIHGGFFHRGSGLDFDIPLEIGSVGDDSTMLIGAALGPRYELIPRRLAVRARVGVGLVGVVTTEMTDPPADGSDEPYHGGVYAGATAGADLHVGGGFWLAADAGFQRSTTFHGRDARFTAIAVDGAIFSGSFYYQFPM